MAKSSLAAILRTHEAALLNAWLAEPSQTANIRNRISEAELRSQSREFLELFQQAVTEAGEHTSLNTGFSDLSSPAFKPLRRFLETVSASRTQLGFSPSETAMFVFSFKPALFAHIRTTDLDPISQVEELTLASSLLDGLGLLTTEAHQKVRESVILRQQQEMMELSTPVVKLWDGVLALPIIGTLDSSRAQTIMESLLERIVATGSEIAIIDITGVPTVDTLTAQHLLKTVTAARLMGAECIISGIRPQIAQTIVHLGVELGDVITKASLADAFKIALQRTNYTIVKRTTSTK
ncbi:STAS domain-containing protein [Granulicella tundricola]|uniref:Anti-sigma-factor antagonist n=1 Tax=Granulicella tundricola (strain ATCC BAA-1859 / DSM 23138 / MP5ACTX9) TaxID=1198114 RepID=E8X3D0_GRATM|nr:STAS domain-containing protein [Granulicella tundricola]ADW70431.1 anti-sigma-factor antagonist [Granulicella tundricola MP5ACTX9]